MFHRFELLPHGSRQGHTRLVVWLLTTMLTAVFTWKIAVVLPLALVVAVWVMV